jgi:putative ABC transport system permease protein
MRKPGIPYNFYRLFRWFCQPGLFEELQGDLEEAFEENKELYGNSKAKSIYRKEVLKMIRPSVIRRSKIIGQSNSISMFKSNLKIAWRSLKGQPFFTTLNTFGLAVGMAGGLLISLFIYDELSFDKMFTDSDRIYRINIDNKTAGEVTKYASAPGPMAAVVTDDCPQAELVYSYQKSRR